MFFLARRRSNANYNHSFARIVGASRGAATAPVARPRENPQGEPLRRTPGATKPTIFMRKLLIFMRKLINGEGAGRNRPQESEEHPQRTPQKALFKHASSSTVPSSVGFANPWSAPGQLSLWSKVQRRHLSACTGQPQLQKKSDRVVAADKRTMYTKHQL